MGETPRELRPPARRVWPYAAAAVAIPLVAMIAERAMGRLWLSKSGTFQFWVNQTNGPETSQQMFDWYSITHMTHGVAFFFVVWLVSRGKCPTAWSALIALLLESAWEVFENCPFTINRFRAGTAADAYTGDTVLNSMFDIVSCMVGWAVARYLPWWASVAFVVLTEVGLALAVRDNLTLSILMLIHPFAGIKAWQQGG